MKRLFIGSKVDPLIFSNIYPKLKKDFEEALFGKWVEPRNLHFTYSFLGNVEEYIIPEILFSLKDELARRESPILFRGMGAFPNFRKPRVLYVNMINDGSIKKLQSSIVSKLDALGFPPEEREFKPHLTLMRIKDFYSSELREAVEKWNNFDFGEMQSFSVSLIESKLTPAGPIYSEIK